MSSKAMKNCQPIEYKDEEEYIPLKCLGQAWKCGNLCFPRTRKLLGQDDGLFKVS